MANISSPISIIGAGWAGLAAAVKLSQAGIPVYVFESAAQAGGRARDIPLRNISLDNGQHIITGAYKNVLDVLETTGSAYQQTKKTISAPCHSITCPSKLVDRPVWQNRVFHYASFTNCPA